MRLFHCRRNEATAAAILRRGFAEMSDDPTQIADAMSFLQDRLPAALKKQVKGLLESERDATFDLDALYHKHLSHGSLIWLSQGAPDREWGEWCFEVKLPKNAIVAHSDIDDDIYVAWVPYRPIPPKHFRLLREDEYPT